MNVAEATSKAAPLALQTHRISPNGKRESISNFRYRDGTFYRQVWEAGEWWLTHVLADPMNKRGSIGIALGIQATKALQGGHAKRILPDGIVSDILTYASSTGHFENFYREKGAGIVAPPDAEKTMVEAGEVFQKACEDFLLIDGELWERCPEPVLSLDVHHRPGRIGCLSAAFLPSEAFAGQTGRPALTEILFPILGYDDARRLSDRSFDQSAPWRSKDFKFDLRMPEVFSDELPSSEVIGQLDHCSRVHPDKTTRERLNSFVCNPAGWTECGMQDEVDNALSNTPDIEKWKVPALVHQQRRFDSKAIHIPMTGSGALKMGM
ncbi:hypothetical protein HFN89_05750 [Rhizobium laguerreae]|nr:hypothetical protein [Rhizobium laguerreae]